MQTLVSAIRATGAQNLTLVAGLDYANDLTGWLKYPLWDPLHNLAASWHSYNWNRCATQTCWDATIAPVAAHVPVVASAIGENDCAHGYIDKLMSWADTHQVSYLAMTWNTWGCGDGPALIKNLLGEPTNFGVGFKDHLTRLTELRH